MEKIKKIRPQDMAMEQIQWYIQENQLKPLFEIMLYWHSINN